MRTPTLLVTAGALTLTLGCGFLRSGNNDAGGAPPPPPAPATTGRTTEAVPAKPAATKTQRTGVPAQPAKLGGCTKVPNGNTCRMQGSGFGYNELVNVAVVGEGRPKWTVYADNNGAWTWDYAIRSGPGTVITVRAEGAASGRHAEFSYTLT
ncbi:MAG TPA: hypothetical protein VL738_12920 [Dactylosporangium sp.]|nr:hypothetical protein [Dactylosporangium sp.]